MARPYMTVGDDDLQLLETGLVQAGITEDNDEQGQRATSTSTGDLTILRHANVASIVS